jgi:hypothetical protein
MATHWIPDTDPSCIIAVEKDGTMSFVKPSKIHATPEEVLAENRAKNAYYVELEKQGLSLEDFNWSMEEADRKFSVSPNKVLSPTEQSKFDLAVSITESKEAELSEVN